MSRSAMLMCDTSDYNSYRSPSSYNPTYSTVSSASENEIVNVQRSLNALNVATIISNDPLFEENATHVTIEVSTDGGFTQGRPASYKWKPSIYEDDFLSDEQLKAKNGGRSYVEALTFGGPKYATCYHMRWPGAKKTPSSLHINSGDFEVLDIVFHTDSSTMTMPEWLEKSDKVTGEVRITVDKKQLMPILAQRYPGFFEQRNQAILYTIHEISRDNNLPLVYDTVISSLNSKKGINQWADLSGVHAHPASIRENGKFHHIIPRQETVTNGKRILFMANQKVLNSADFSRWINVDAKQLKHDLERSIENGKCYIPAPATPDCVEATSVLQFVVINEFMYLCRLCELKGYEEPMFEERSAGVFVCVRAEALKILIEQKLKKIDRTELLMNMDEITLSLTPLVQKNGQWKKDIEKIIGWNKLTHKEGQMDTVKHVFFCGQYRFVFERYKGEDVAVQSAANTNAQVVPLVISSTISHPHSHSHTSQTPTTAGCATNRLNW